MIIFYYYNVNSYAVLKYGSDQQCECLTMRIHNHYEGFELILSLIGDLNIDKVKESDVKNEKSKESEFSDDFEDTFEDSFDSSRKKDEATSTDTNTNTNTNDGEGDGNTNNDNYNVNEEGINELQMQLASILCGMGARCPLICERVYIFALLIILSYLVQTTCYEK